MTTTARPRAPEHTDVRFDIKSIDSKARSVSGTASAFTIDEGGDLIRPGAYSVTLAAWRRDGYVIPLIDQHNYGSIFKVVGKLTDARETSDGLDTRFEFVPDDPTADAAYRRVAGGFITGLSIGYKPVRWSAPSEEERRAGAIRILDEVELVEVSLVIWPMNDDARVATTTAKGGHLSAYQMAALKRRLVALNSMSPAKQAALSEQLTRFMAPHRARSAAVKNALDRALYARWVAEHQKHETALAGQVQLQSRIRRLLSAGGY